MWELLIKKIIQENYFKKKTSLAEKIVALMAEIDWLKEKG